MLVNSDSLIQELIEAFRCLPGVGSRTAQRMAYYLLQDHGRHNYRAKGIKLAKVLQKAMEVIIHCEHCNNLTENTVCYLCLHPMREKQVLCIVAQPSDVIAIEQAKVYKGLYYVLMGHLSPLDGIGPEELGIPKIIHHIKENNIQEVILALSPTVEGEATIFYLSELLHSLKIPVSQLAQGIPSGGELEYLDSHTIGRALTARKRIETRE